MKGDRKEPQDRNSHFSDNDGQDHRLIVEAQHLGQPPVDLRRLLDLVADVDLPELLEKAEQGELELFAPVLIRNLKQASKLRMLKREGLA